MKTNISQTAHEGKLRVVDGGLSKKAHPAKFDSNIPDLPYFSDLITLCAEFKLPDNIFRFLSIIRNHMSRKNKECFPAYIKIAKKMACSTDKVKDMRRIAERLGIIQVTRKPRKPGGNPVNHYRFRYAPGWNFDEIEARIAQENEEKEIDSGGLNKTRNDESGGAGMPPQRGGKSTPEKGASRPPYRGQIDPAMGCGEAPRISPGNQSKNQSIESVQSEAKNDGDFEDELDEDDVLDILNNTTATPSQSNSVRNSNRECVEVVEEPMAQDEAVTWDLNEEKTEMEREESPPAPPVGAQPRYEPVYTFRPKDIPGYPTPRDLLDDECTTMRLGDLTEPFKDQGEFFEQFDDRFEPEDFDTKGSPAWEVQLRLFYDQVIDRHWDKDGKPPGAGFRKLFRRAAVSGVLSSFGFKPEADDVFFEKSAHCERMAQSVFEEPVLSYLLALGFITDEDTVKSLADMLEEASKEPSLAKKKRDLEAQIETLEASIARDEVLGVLDKKTRIKLRELEKEQEKLEDAKEPADLKRAQLFIEYLKKIEVDTALGLTAHVKDEEEQRKQFRQDIKAYPELWEFIKLRANGSQWHDPEKERKSIWDFNMDKIRKIVEEERLGVEELGYKVEGEEWLEDFVRYLKDNERIIDLKKFREKRRRQGKD